MQDHQATIAEIIEIPNPERRHRGYPRVVKRHYAKYHPTKREHHAGGWYPGPPKINILENTA